MTQTHSNQPGSQPGPDWGNDQKRRDRQDRDRRVQTNQHPAGSPDGSPTPHDEDHAGTTTKPAGSEGTTRY